MSIRHIIYLSIYFCQLIILLIKLFLNVSNDQKSIFTNIDIEIEIVKNEKTSIQHRNKNSRKANYREKALIKRVTFIQSIIIY